jgi:hypothetical protein
MLEDKVNNNKEISHLVRSQTIYLCMSGLKQFRDIAELQSRLFSSYFCVNNMIDNSSEISAGPLSTTLLV